MSDRFEDELKNRLRYYEEEPRNELWDNIAPKVVVANKRTSSTWSWLLLVPALLIPVQIGFVYSDVKERTSLRDSSEYPYDSILLVVENERLSGNLDPVSAYNLAEPVNYSKVNNLDTYDQHIHQSEEVSMAIVPSTERHNGSMITSALDSDKSFSVLSGAQEVVIQDPEERAHKSEKATTELSIREPDGTIVRKQGLKPRRHSIYLIAMPTFGYQRIESNQNDNIIIESIKRIPAFSVKRLGLRAEAGVEIEISRRVKLFTGLLYYQRKQTIDFTERTVDSLRITGENGEVRIDPVFKYADKSLEYELKNLGIQFGFNYELSRTKFLHVLGTGFELHKPVNKSRFNEINRDFGQHPDYYVFYNLYYRLQYPSTGRLRAVFQPSFNYSLYINQNLNGPFYVKPYGLGLHVGCTYNF